MNQELNQLSKLRASIRRKFEALNISKDDLPPIFCNEIESDTEGKYFLRIFDNFTISFQDEQYFAIIGGVPFIADTGLEIFVLIIQRMKFHESLFPFTKSVFIPLLYKND